MKKIESKIGTINQPDEKIYNFLTDFNNFESLIPQDKVSDWESTTDSCSFKVPGVGDANIKIVEKEPHKLIKFEGEGQNGSYLFRFWIQLKQVEENDTKIKITLQPELNQMMAMMVTKPLKNFLNTLVDQIENFHF